MVLEWLLQPAFSLQSIHLESLQTLSVKLLLFLPCIFYNLMQDTICPPSYSKFNIISPLVLILVYDMHVSL